MQSVFYKVFIFSIILLASVCRANAQDTPQAWPGPKGIFLFTGTGIPAGSPLASYLVERLDASGNWVKVEEVKLPPTFRQFIDKVNQSKTLFPDQPLPAQAKLELLYNRAQQTGTVDSLNGWKNYPVRMALGVMCYDAVASKGVNKYRITQVASGGVSMGTFITNEVVMPYKAVFDSIQVDESSRTSKLNYIRWFSVGKKPASLYQPFRYEDGKSVSISGWTGRTTVNDTSYYTFTDSVAGPIKAEQYFIVPFDPFGNAGTSSEILKVAPDAFTRTKISGIKAGRNPDRYGIRISWRCNSPGQLGKIILYRSESKEQGFKEYSAIQPADTVYLDTQAWPGRTYHYYLKAYDSTGKRFITSDKTWFKAELPKKPAVPSATALGINNGVELTITVDDPKTDGIRIFRNDGINESLTAISDFIPLNGVQVIKYADTSKTLSGRVSYTYQVRSETKGAGVSDLSGKIYARPLKNTPPADPAFIRGSVSDNRIRLIWQDVQASDTAVTGYLLVRKEDKRAAEQFSLHLNSWTDSLVAVGKAYSYSVVSLDTKGLKSPGNCRLIVSLVANNPIPPDFIKAGQSSGNQPLTMIEWADVMFEGFIRYNLYRQAAGEEAKLIATLKPGTTRYTDKPERGDVSYTYFITTVHSSGSESSPSEKVKPQP